MGLRNFRMYPYAGDIWWQCLQYCHYRPPYSVWNLWKLYTCKYRGHYLCKNLGQGFCYMPSTFINMMGMEHYFILWIIFEIDLLQSLFVVYLAGLIFYNSLFFNALQKAKIAYIKRTTIMMGSAWYTTNTILSKDPLQE